MKAEILLLNLRVNLGILRHLPLCSPDVVSPALPLGSISPTLGVI